MNSKIILFGKCISIAFSMIIITSCEDNIKIDETTDTPNERMDIVLTKSEAGVTSATTDFTVSFLQAITKVDRSNSNVIISPFSMHAALSMTASGANGQTRAEMINALCLEGISSDDVSSFYHKMIPALVDVDNTTSISIANSVWARSEAPLRKEYVSMLKDDFDATSHDINIQTLQNDVNSWVKKATCGVIDNMPLPIDPDNIKFMLMNALHFNGIWDHPFDASKTRSDVFHNIDGSESKIPFMRKSGFMTAFVNDYLSSVNLYYGNGAYRMTLILPEKSMTIEQMINNLDVETLNGCLSEAQLHDVDLSLPRFECEYGNDKLKEALELMGIHRAFTNDAEFGGISDNPIMIGAVMQKAKINVDEKGTEAAAATIVAGVDGADPRNRLSFKLDRPFVYTISEVSTGAILFAGVQREF